MSGKSELPDFSGRYLANRRLHLLELLGAGAYGKVYKARDTTSSKKKPIFYAVKCMKKHDIGSRHDSYQKREFALHARVARHPNIITFFDVIEKGLYVYIVLGVCTGGDLHAAIVNKRLFYNNDKLVNSAFLQLLDAVEFCHQMGVFHRDIKPDNILCTGDGSHLFLADFGLATTVSVSKEFGCGSMFYKSPECMGALLEPTYGTKESDIWSLGVVLVNMITGRCPWRVAKASDPSFQKAIYDPDYLQKTLPMSTGAIAVTKRIFELEPTKRASIGTLRYDIGSVSTFFLTEAELSMSPPQVRMVAGYFDNRALVDISEGLSRGVRMKGLARPMASVEFLGLRISHVKVERQPTARHRPPCNTDLFPPRRLFKRVVHTLKTLSGTTSSSSSV